MVGTMKSYRKLGSAIKGIFILGMAILGIGFSSGNVIYKVIGVVLLILGLIPWHHKHLK